ncbi:MAG TPA: hypothetical protein VEC99_15420 [Clostridia bacterium]|nr:hypothetical protein [Clostridia bacterium]
MNDELTITKLVRLRRMALLAGLAGLILCAIGAFLNTRQFFFSYLFGYLFWMGTTLGCFGLVMLHHLVGGRWGFIIRRFLETGICLLPLMALLFVPLLFGVQDLYAWARPKEVAASEILRHQSAFLNWSGFIFRLVLFFGIWFALGFLLNRWSMQQDQTTDPTPTRKLRILSGPGLVLHILVTTFALIDWIMVLEYHWYSTIFPILTIVGHVMTALALAIILLAAFRQQEWLAHVVTPTHLHHLGNLLMAFMLLWTYMAFSQLLIIYAGNLPHEATWYLHRSQGGWQWVAVFLALFHFAVPFAFLLRRAIKRKTWSLTTIAVLLFFVHAVNDFWLVAPSLHPKGFYFHWLDLAAFVGVGGIWLALFFTLLKRKSLWPRNDPRLEFLLAHAH